MTNKVQWGIQCPDKGSEILLWFCTITVSVNVKWVCMNAIFHSLNTFTDLDMYLNINVGTDNAQ